MTDLSRIKPSHTQRAAYVYVRQSTPGQYVVRAGDCVVMPAIVRQMLTATWNRVGRMA